MWSNQWGQVNNPYQTDLVNFLISERKHLEKMIPAYYSNWLDKENHFHLVYKHLKAFLDVRS